MQPAGTGSASKRNSASADASSRRGHADATTCCAIKECVRKPRRQAVARTAHRVREGEPSCVPRAAAHARQRQASRYWPGTATTREAVAAPEPGCHGRSGRPRARGRRPATEAAGPSGRRSSRLRHSRSCGSGQTVAGSRAHAERAGTLPDTRRRRRSTAHHAAVRPQSTTRAATVVECRLRRCDRAQAGTWVTLPPSRVHDHSSWYSPPVLHVFDDYRVRPAIQAQRLRGCECNVLAAVVHDEPAVDEQAGTVVGRQRQRVHA